MKQSQTDQYMTIRNLYQMGKLNQGCLQQSRKLSKSKNYQVIYLEVGIQQGNTLETNNLQ